MRKHLSVRHLLLVRHRSIVDIHRHFDGVVAQQPLDDLRIPLDRAEEALASFSLKPFPFRKRPTAIPVEQRQS